MKPESLLTIKFCFMADIQWMVANRIVLYAGVLSVYLDEDLNAIIHLSCEWHLLMLFNIYLSGPTEFFNGHKRAPGWELVRNL